MAMFLLFWQPAMWFLCACTSLCSRDGLHYISTGLGAAPVLLTVMQSAQRFRGEHLIMHSADLTCYQPSHVSLVGVTRK